MEKQTQTEETSFSIELLKQLAFMQHEGEDYFLYNGKAYEGNEQDARNQFEDSKGDERFNYNSFSDYCKEHRTQVEEFNNDDYLVLTDEEADEKAAEYIKDSLWAFNADFIIEHSKLPYEAAEMIKSYQSDKCESANETIEALIEDMDEFIEDAISADGRGHFMSSYDGEEHEETVYVSTDDETGKLIELAKNDTAATTFYIYRLN